MEESGLWSAWCRTCLQEQTERPFSVVSLAFAGHVGSGQGAGGAGGSGWGGTRGCGFTGQELPQKLLEGCESVLGGILCLSGRCIKRGGSLGSCAVQPFPVRCPRRLGEDAGPVPVSVWETGVNWIPWALLLNQPGSNTEYIRSARNRSGNM